MTRSLMARREIQRGIFLRVLGEANGDLENRLNLV